MRVAGDRGRHARAASTPCASSATARAAAWASRSPRRPPAGAPRSPWWPPTSRCRAAPASRTSTWRRAEQLRVRRSRALPGLRRAADGGRGGRLPARRARAGQDRQGAQRRLSSSSSCAPPTCWRSCRSVAAAGQMVVGFAAEHGGQAVERARGKLERKGLDAMVLNDVSRRADRLRRRAERGHDRRRPRASTRLAARRKHEVAAAILDRVQDASPRPQACATAPGRHAQ